MTAGPLSSALAEETAPVRRGREGLVPVPFAADNAGGQPLSCSVALAHWYSAGLGRAAAGGRVDATLWYDPADGRVLLLNGLDDQMPVQALWCGPWAHRAAIALPRRAGETPGPIRVTCRDEGEATVCR